jgi:hypothetical protein
VKTLRNTEGLEKSVRIHEGDYAYEVERVLDPATQVQLGWRYNIYRARPVDRLVSSGEAKTREAAEHAGKKALEEAIKMNSQSAA